MLGRGREEECGNEVPCRGRGLGAGWQNGFESNWTDSRAADLACSSV